MYFAKRAGIFACAGSYLGVGLGDSTYAGRKGAGISGSGPFLRTGSSGTKVAAGLLY